MAISTRTPGRAGIDSMLRVGRAAAGPGVPERTTAGDATLTLTASIMMITNVRLGGCQCVRLTP
jgi:hypothetical protein